MPTNEQIDLSLQNAYPGLGERTLDASHNGLLSDVLRIESEFDRALEFGQDDRYRNQRNWQLYGGICLGQYTQADQAKAKMEGRNLATLNFATQKVDSLHGNLMKNMPDADYVAVEGVNADATQLLKSMYLSDKEMMDWGTSENQLVKGGLIYEGVEEMFIDRRFHPLGNIAFRCHLPGYVLFDPRWKTQSAKDCQIAWVCSYLTASQLAEMYPEKAQLFWRDIESTRTIGEWWDDVDNTGVTPMFNLDRTNAGRNLYRVIRKFEMTTKIIVIDYDTETGIDIPAGSSIADKLAHLNKTNPRWEEKNIKQRQEREKVCIVTTVCSAVDTEIPLEKKPSEIQIGRIPLFPWAAERINGVPRGIIDLIYDVQQKINYREELVTNIIESAARTALLADPALFNEEEDKMRDFEENSNQPWKIVWTAPGASARGMDPKPIRNPQVLPEVQAQLMRLLEYMDRLSKSPAVFDARSEKSGESGYLFAQKSRVAEQQSYTLFSSLSRHLAEKAEAYMLQAKIQYTLGGLERRFILDGGKHEVIINRRFFDGKDTKTENDFATLPRHKVVISESPESTTNRLITRALATEVMKVVPPENIGTRSVLNTALVMTLDNFTSADKDRLQEMRGLEEMQAKLTLMANINKLKLANLQLEQQFKVAEKGQQAANAAANAGPAQQGMAPADQTNMQLATQPPIVPGTGSGGGGTAATPATELDLNGPPPPEQGEGYKRQPGEATEPNPNS